MTTLLATVVELIYIFIDMCTSILISYIIINKCYILCFNSGYIMEWSGLSFCLCLSLSPSLFCPRFQKIPDVSQGEPGTFYLPALAFWELELNVWIYKLSLIVLLISLIINNGEHLFLCLLNISHLFQKFLKSLSPFLNVTSVLLLKEFFTYFGY